MSSNSRIIVVADHRELDEAMPRCIHQCSEIGRRYVLVPSVIPGNFHPKMILRIGEEGGAVWIGSGNLTSGGWGGNAELATSWQIGPRELDPGGWVPKFLDRLRQYVTSDLFNDKITSFEHPGWLRRLDEGAMSPFLIGGPDAPLASQLAARWQGRRFTEVKLTTGSTDDRGAFLEWARQTFGIQKAVIYLDPARSSFDVERLSQIDMEITIAAVPSSVGLHAKCYWFSGPDGDAAAIGSANCSHAAWLPITTGNGNVEIMLLYDEADTERFTELLSRLDIEEFGSPEKLLPTLIEKPKKPAKEPGPFLKLSEVEMRASQFEIAARINPSPSSDAELILDLSTLSNTETVTLEKSESDWWVSKISEHIARSPHPIYARLRIQGLDDAADTQLRWVRPAPMGATGAACFPSIWVPTETLLKDRVLCKPQ